MPEPVFKVLKLIDANDNCPFDQWIDGVRNKNDKARIRFRIDRLTRGNFGDHKGVGDGVSELRLFFGPGYRVYYGLVGTLVVVLLGGSDKKDQSQEIKSAKQLWASFIQEGQPESALLALQEEDEGGNDEQQADEA